MHDINKQIDRAIELLWLCQSLQSEKDGVNRPINHEIDRTKVRDAFAQDIDCAVANVSALHQMIPLHKRLSAVGRELARRGVLNLSAGESHADAALSYLEMKL